MKIDIEVSGSIEDMQPPEVIHPASRGFLVQIGFFLKDKLKVIDEEGEVTKSQRCYEQIIIPRYSTQIRDASYAEQLAYNALHYSLDMDPTAAERAKTEVAETIMNQMEVARNDNPSNLTVFMEIRVDCTIEISDEEAFESSGEHGYDRLLERLGDADCAICREEFDSDDHILVTTCHHTFHHSCLFEWEPNAECPLVLVPDLFLLMMYEASFGEMKIDIEVSGSIDDTQPREFVHPASRGLLVTIGFFLKDKLKVIDEDGEVTKSQCCCEQITISRRSTQIRDASDAKRLAYNTLRHLMEMDRTAAERAETEVAETIMNQMEVARNDNPPNVTVFMEIRVDCTIEISDEEASESSGEHGYDRLLERLGDDECAICCEEFDSDDHILVTTCHHTFHHSCLFEWLTRLPLSCPLCRSDLSPIMGGPIRF
ncbi:RING finger protein 122 [Nymphaea thermarum]|nr:RING finger protein 122 [Nymphaea thermarum]